MKAKEWLGLVVLVLAAGFRPTRSLGRINSRVDSRRDCRDDARMDARDPGDENDWHLNAESRG